jgi:hypothetical protein
MKKAVREETYIYSYSVVSAVKAVRSICRGYMLPKIKLYHLHTTARSDEMAIRLVIVVSCMISIITRTWEFTEIRINGRRH